MRIMCDTNIVLDVLMDRDPFAESSSRVLYMCEEQKAEGFVSASAVTDIFYLVRKHTHSVKQAYFAIGRLLSIVKAASVTHDDVLTAFQRQAKDFEDSLVAVCAESASCDYIVTRNKRDFAEFGVRALTPEEFLEVVAPK